MTIDKKLKLNVKSNYLIMKKFFVIILTLFTILLVRVKVLAQEEATPEGDPIREAVQEKIEEAQNKPVAYLGTVTDIVENTVQIKSIEGEIKQVSVNDDTKFVKVNSSTTTVNYSDIAIGDFLVNMGYRNPDDVLVVGRTLVTSRPEKPKRESVFGKVTEKLNTEITIEIKNNSEFLTISPERNIVVTKKDENETIRSRFADIEEESIIFAVGVRSEDSFSARSIHIVETPLPSENPDESSE